MILKFLIAVLVIMAGWMMWRGPGKYRKPGTPIDRQPASSPEAIEARRVLGVDARASDDEIRAAYRRIAAAVHPDRGGSAELARQVNAARDILIGRGPDSAA